MKITQHPLSAAFPGMSEADHAALTADIEQHGQRDAITLYDGMVLDGWHRYSSCLELGIEPRFTTLPGETDPVPFVLSCNLHRRHLDGSQRAAARVKCGDWAQVGSNQHGGSKPGLQPTASEMAKEADVSRQTIQHAKAAQVAGLGDAVRDGRMTAKTAAKIAKLPEDQRAAAVANPAILKTPKKPKPLQPAIEQEPAQAWPEMVTMTTADYDELMALVEEYRVDQKALEAVLDADDKLAEAGRQIRMLTAQIATLTSSRDGLMNADCELKKIIKSRDYRIKNLEKELEQYTVRLDSGGMPI